VRRERRLLWLVVVVATAGTIVSAVLLVGFMLRGGPNDQDHLATVISGVLTVVTSAAGFATWLWARQQSIAAELSVSTSEQVRAAAYKLAQVMRDVWQKEAAERGITVPAPVSVAWRWGPVDMTPPIEEVFDRPPIGGGPIAIPGITSTSVKSRHVGWRRPRILVRGVVNELHDDLYAQLPYGRLVLIGGPGAGKTGAMILLLLAALEHRVSMPHEQQDQIPVPVWLTLGGWDPAAQSLRQWAAATMVRDHPYLQAVDFGPNAADELLATGRIALFLDGLDEMPDPGRSAALEKVDCEASGLRIVLTSRIREYGQACGHEQAHRPAAVIEVLPVSPVTASKYLTRGHDQAATRRRWRELANYLRSHPDSPVAEALNTPLTLSLARATYAADQDPTELSDQNRFCSSTAVRRHLIQRIMTTAYPLDNEREHAIRSLAWIADHMNGSRDLRWWDIPAWIPFWQLRAGVGLGVALVIGLGGGMGGGIVFGPVFGIDLALAFGLAGGLIVAFLGGLAAGSGEPRSLIIRRPRLWQLRSLILSGRVSGLVAGLVVGLGGGLISGLRGGFVSGLLFGLLLGLVGGFVGGLVGGLVDGVWSVPLAHNPALTPESAYYSDRHASVVSGIMGGLAGGLMGGLVFWAAGGLVGILGVGLGAGLGVGVGVGPTFLVGVTELVLRMRWHQRVCFIEILQKAHQRQVLRQAGGVYQFRHAELQDRLAKAARGENASF
jgi:hypothetical protein